MRTSLFPPEVNEVNDTLSVPFFAKKNRRHIVYNCLESGHCGGWKNKTLVFLIYFDSNHLENTLGTLFNQSIAFKNLKNHPKTHNQPEIQNLSKLRSIFYRCFQGEKTLNHNSPHHMK